MKPPASVARLRRKLAASPLGVLVGTMAATTFLRLGSNLILTRLLAPEAFGIIGLLAAITVVLQLMTDMGLSAFIIRLRENVDRRFLNVIWTIRLFRSLGLATIMFCSADLLAAAFDKPDLATPIRVTAFLFVLEGLSSLHPTVALRERRVSYHSSVEFAVFLIQLLATIAACFWLRSFWGIVVGMYVQGFVHLLFSYILYPGGLHRIAFDRTISRDLWKFARLVIVSSIITLVLGQADRIFIGRTMPLDMLGLYMLALNFTGAARSFIQSYTTKIVFPLLAETFRKAPQTLNTVYYDSRRRLTLVLAFLLGGGIGGGRLLIRILLDDRYLDAGLFVSILCLGPLFLLMTKPAEHLMFARGRIRATLEGNVVRLVWVAAAAPAGFFYFGVMGLIVAFAMIEVAAAAYWSVRLRLAGVLKAREEGLALAVAAFGATIGFALDQTVARLIADGVIPSF